MSSRPFKRFFALLAVLVLLGALPAGADGPSLRSEAGAFLSGLKVAEPVREKLLALADRPVGDGNAAVVQAEDGGQYCLALVPVQQDPDADVAAELELFSQNRALFLARGRLALSLGQEKVDRRLYRHDEALARALSSYYGPRGVEAASDVLKETREGYFAAALAWLSPENAKALGENAPPPEDIDEEYCRFLYLSHARGLFSAGRYSEALPLFKNIHDLHWMDIDAYLDAAECFLRMGQPGECLTLLRELRAALDEKMGSGELTRLGRLCREAGDRDAALSAFVAARERYREGK